VFEGGVRKFLVYTTSILTDTVGDGGADVVC
jgi:hypothetical protein